MATQAELMKERQLLTGRSPIAVSGWPSMCQWYDPDGGVKCNRNTFNHELYWSRPSNYALALFITSINLAIVSCRAVSDASQAR